MQLKWNHLNRVNAGKEVDLSLHRRCFLFIAYFDDNMERLERVLVGEGWAVRAIACAMTRRVTRVMTRPCLATPRPRSARRPFVVQ